MSRGRVAGAAARTLIYCVELYRTMISPLRPASCRFTPTCSQYAVDALGEFGLVRGSWLTLVRLAKCGPWHGGGWDPIPERHEIGCRRLTDSGGAVDNATLRSDSFV